MEAEAATARYYPAAENHIIGADRLGPTGAADARRTHIRKLEGEGGDSIEALRSLCAGLSSTDDWSVVSARFYSGSDHVHAGLARQFPMLTPVDSVGRAVNAFTRICSECYPGRPAPQEDKGNLSQGCREAALRTGPMATVIQATMREGVVMR